MCTEFKCIFFGMFKLQREKTYTVSLMRMILKNQYCDIYVLPICKYIVINMYLKISLCYILASRVSQP